MAGENDDAASKTEEPSAKKLSDARQRGEVVKTPELSSLLSLTAAFAVVAIGGGYLATDMAHKLQPFLAHPDAMRLDGAGGALESTGNHEPERWSDAVARGLRRLCGAPFRSVPCRTPGKGGRNRPRPIRCAARPRRGSHP